MAAIRKKKSSSRRHRHEPDPRAARIGARIRELRDEKALSFADAVAATGLGKGTLSELERGLVVPTVSTLARIAEVLEVTVADLVVDDSPRERVFEALRRLPKSVAAKVLADVKLRANRA